MGKQKIKIPTNTNIKTESKSWIIKIVLLTFVISIVFAAVSNGIIPILPLWAELILLLVFVLIGVVFNIVGTAVSAGSQTPFHSMSTQGVKGSRHALWLIRNAEKVSNFCSDAIGDISSIIIGASAALIVRDIVGDFNQYTFYLMIIGTGIISSITIACDAWGKMLALKHSNQIVYHVALFLCFFKREKK